MKLVTRMVVGIHLGKKTLGPVLEKDRIFATLFAVIGADMSISPR